MDRLIVFVKAPRPGFVKTRLAKSIGAIEACEAYQCLARTLFERLASLESVELRYAPDDGYRDIEPWIQRNWTASPQGSGDLGVRMENAFREAFAQGCERVVLIGSDCPEVTARDIETAWQRLLDYELVLGPAEDGGYWLIGLRRLESSLFVSMPWSTDAVLQETMRRARASGLNINLLRKLADIDTETEWCRFQAGQ